MFIIMFHMFHMKSSLSSPFSLVLVSLLLAEITTSL